MSKEKYHVNKPKSNKTCKILGASILFVFSFVISVLFLKYFVFPYAKKDDSICEFVTFGFVQDRQSNLKHSTYWRRIESDIKKLCNFGNSVEIYSVGNIPVLKRLVNESTIANSNNESEILTNGNHDHSNGLPKPVPSLSISGQEISNNLLYSVDLQFGDEIWTVVWQKVIGRMKFWKIDAQNIDALNISPLILMHKIVEKFILQLVFTITLDECYKASVRQTVINCTDFSFIPKMRAEIVKPLMKSFMTNGTECAQTEFHIDHFEKIGQTNGNFEQLERSNSSNIIRFEVKLCH